MVLPRGGKLFGSRGIILLFMASAFFVVSVARPKIGNENSDSAKHKSGFGTRWGRAPFVKINPTPAGRPLIYARGIGYCVGGGGGGRRTCSRHRRQQRRLDYIWRPTATDSGKRPQIHVRKPNENDRQVKRKKSEANWLFKIDFNF